MCLLADKLGRPLHEIREMPLTDFHTLLNYYRLVAEKEKKAADKARKSGSAPSKPRRSKAR